MKIIEIMNLDFFYYKPSPHPKNQEGNPICCTCTDLEISSPLHKLDCGHYHCENCLKDTIHETIIMKYKSFLKVPCGYSYCNCAMSFDLVKLLANEDAIAWIDLIIEETIPKTKKLHYSLEELGYFYNEKQQLRLICEPEKPFYYITERHYDALGEAIVQEIHRIMIEKYEFNKIYINEKKQNYIMISKDFDEKSDIMIICPGSGAVQAGQWARALCINDSLHTGAMLDYIEEARSRDYGILILNPNKNWIPAKINLEDNCDFLNSDPKMIEERIFIKNSKSGDEHYIWAWDTYIMNAPNLERVFIVAHSAGGYETLELLRNRFDEVEPLIKAFGFTDSVHSISKKDQGIVSEMLSTRAVNWVTSKKELNTVLNYDRGCGCECRSAGTKSHELTSSSCQKHLFRFFEYMRGNENDPYA